MENENTVLRVQLKRPLPMDGLVLILRFDTELLNAVDVLLLYFFEFPAIFLFLHSDTAAGTLNREKSFVICVLKPILFVDTLE
jgi:hypothetical protein